MDWEVIITPLAENQLKAISDRRVRQGIENRIDDLETDAEQKGKTLVADLAGLRSIRAVGQRYRIIYRVDASQRTVFVVSLGIRKEGDKADIYALAKKLLRAGLLTLLLLLSVINTLCLHFSNQ